MSEFGDFLRDVRQGRGLTIRDAAKLAGISHSRLFDLEKGRSSKTRKAVVPSVSNLEGLARAYGIELSVLVAKAMLPARQGDLSALSADELRAVAVFRALPPSRKRLWLDVGEGLRDLAD